MGASSRLIDERRARAHRRESRRVRGGSEEERALTETLRRAAALVTLRCRCVRGDVQGQGLGAGQHRGPRRVHAENARRGRAGREGRRAGLTAAVRVAENMTVGCFERDASEGKRKRARLGTRLARRP